MGNYTVISMTWQLDKAFDDVNSHQFETEIVKCTQ